MQRKLFITLLLCLLLNSSNQSRLVHLTVLARHSARHPVQNYFNHEGIESGQLTQKGLLLAEERGYAFAEKYNYFLKEVNLEEEAKFSSSDVPRTIVTLIYRLKGMLRYIESNLPEKTVPDSIKETVKISSEIAYREIEKLKNVRVYQRKEDFVFWPNYHCLDKIMIELEQTEKFQNHVKELLELGEKHSELLKDFKHKLTDGNNKSVINAYLYLSDYLDLAPSSGIQLPSDHMKLRNLLSGNYQRSYKAITYSKLVIDLTNAVVTKKLLSNFSKAIASSKANNPSYRKFNLLSGHDANFAIILAFFGIDVMELDIDFNTELAFEVYEDLHNQFPSRYYIMIRFEGTALPMPFCNYNVHCDSEVFLNFIKENRRTQEDYMEFCGSSVKKQDL